MDIFCEYMVKHKKSGKDYLVLAGIIIGAIFLSTIAFALLFRRLFGFEILIFAGIWYGAYVLIGRTEIEYEYILTNGILDIDKIMAKRARKRVISIDFKNIEVCSPAKLITKSNNPAVKVLDLAGNINAENVYYVDFSKDAVMHRVFFQPNTKILNNLKLVNPHKITINEEDIK